MVYRKLRLIIFIGVGLLISPFYIDGVIAKDHNLKSKVILKQDSPIYSEPKTSSKILKQAPQFSIFFVKEDKNITVETQNNAFFRVHIPWADEESAPVQGWVAGSQVIQWNHRLALRINPSSERKSVLWFKDLESAEQWISTPQENNDHEDTVFDVSAINNKYPKAFFPIVDKKVLSHNSHEYRLFKVALLYNEEQAEYLDLLFLLDTTQSMEDYVKALSQEVESITKLFQENKELGIRVGILCYKNYSDAQSPSKYTTKQFLPLTSQYDQFVKVLKEDVKAEDANDDDTMTTMFQAIGEAINKTKWSSSRGLRTIVLISDVSGSSTENVIDQGNYDLETLSTAASNKGIRFLAVKIKSRNEEHNSTHKLQILQQLVIGKMIGDRGVYLEIDSPKKLISQLTVSLNRQIALVGRLLKAKAIDSQPTVYTPKIGEIGWIAERKNVTPRVSPFVFMTSDDLALYIFSLQTVLTLTKDFAEAIKKIITETIYVLTGERLERKEGLRTYYQKRRSLPYSSDLLNLEPERITILNENVLESWRKKIRSKVKQLETHRDNQELWQQISGSNIRYTLIPLDLLP